jgi:hypothetical protein
MDIPQPCSLPIISGKISLASRAVAVKNTVSCKQNPQNAGCEIQNPGEEVSLDQVFIIRDSIPSPITDLNENFIVVADTKNHCIRMLDLNQEIVVTIAGRCGVVGFKDGPLGNNLLNNPTALGLSEEGDIWIYDKGNSYIRVLQMTPFEDGWLEKGELSTMLKGVCRDKPNHISPLYSSPASRYSVCYSNWIKTSGEPSSHIFDKTMLKNYCTDLFSKCKEFEGVHPLYVGMQIYNKTLQNP